MSGDLIKMLGTQGVLRLVVADPQNHVIVCEGDLPLPWQGLYDRLVGGEERIATLRESLRDQILPQVWSQGELDAYVSLTPDEHLVAIFRLATEDAVAGYRLAQQLVRDVEETLGQA
jgi:hypothetical protein